MKKLFSFILSFILLLTLSACGGQNTVSSEISEASSEGSSAASSTVSEVFTAPELEELPTFFEETKPTIKWSPLKCGVTAHIVIETEDGKVILDKSGITGTSYTFETALEWNKTYVLKVMYTRDGTDYPMIGNSKKGKRILCKKQKEAVTLDAISQKIKNSKDYMITFVGDSITFGFRASSPETNFVALTAKGFAEKFKDRTIIRYDGIENGLKQPLKSYSEPITVKTGTSGKIAIVRSGVSGSTMGDTLNRMDADFMGTANGRLPKKADLIIIHLGVNDTSDGIANYKQNMKEVVEKIMLNQPETDIILMTPTSTGDGKATTSPLDSYADAMKSLAKEKGLAIIDVHEEWMKHYTPGGENFGMGALLADQWHPADPGYKLIADKILSDLFK